MKHKWKRLSADFVKIKLCECVKCGLRAWEDEIREGGLGSCEPLSEAERREEAEARAERLYMVN